MKKQVTFAESQSIHRLQQDEAVQSRTRMKESELKHFNGGLKSNRSTATEPQQVQHATGTQIPKSMISAPFLKHSALTPAQREYLRTVAASYSTGHVRKVIAQHYMNVLLRRGRAGLSPDRDERVVTSPENEKPPSETPPQVQVSSGAKQKRKTNTSTR